MICKNCGVELPNEAKFCKKCGMAIPPISEETTINEEIHIESETQSIDNGTDDSTPPSEEDIIIEKFNSDASALPNLNKQKSKKNKIILLASILLIVIVASASIFTYLFINDPVRRINEQLSIAENYLKQENYEKVVEAYSNILKIDPEYPDALMCFADYSLIAGNTTDAIDVYLDLKQNDNDIELILKLANAYKTNNDLDSAQTYFEEYLNLDPENQDAYIEYLDTLIKKEDFENAKQKSEEALLLFESDIIANMIITIDNAIYQQYIDSLVPLDIASETVIAGVDYLTNLGYLATFLSGTPPLSPFTDPKDIDPIFAIRSARNWDLEFIRADDDSAMQLFSLDSIISEIKATINPEFEIPVGFNYSLADSYVLKWFEEDNAYGFLATGGTSNKLEYEVLSAFTDINNNIVLNLIEYEVLGNGEYTPSFEELIVDKQIIGHRNKFYDDDGISLTNTEEIIYQDKNTLPTVTYTLKPMQNGGFNIVSKSESTTNSLTAPSADSDYSITWENTALETYIRDILIIYDRPIMYSDIYDLEELHLYDSEYNNINDLKHFTELKELSVTFAQVSDLTPLSGLTNLTTLNLNFNNISDLSPLSGLTNLTSLSLNNNSISDLSPISSLTNLKYFSAENWHDTSTDYDLKYNDFSDLSPLQNLSELQYLSLYNNQIVDVAPLAVLSDLNRIDLERNYIIDISPLGSMPSLSYLIINQNYISDFSALSGINYVSKADQRELTPLVSDSPTTNLPPSEEIVADLGQHILGDWYADYTYTHETSGVYFDVLFGSLFSMNDGPNITFYPDGSSYLMTGSLYLENCTYAVDTDNSRAIISGIDSNSQDSYDITIIPVKDGDVSYLKLLFSFKSEPNITYELYYKK